MRVYDIGRIDGLHYICMAFIEGISLSRFAIAESCLSEERIAELVQKVALAVAHAHEAGFIHRDLKPANIMVDMNDEPVILDFGLARKTQTDDDIRTTQAGSPLGSPAYMSPEQADCDDDRIGPASDIYSLGVILYELLTGRLPFEGSTASVLGQIMTKAPTPPSAFRKTLTVRLENLCLRMMEKQPEKRHSSMRAVAAELQEYLNRFGTAPEPVPSDQAAETQTVSQGQRRRQQIEQLIKTGDYAQAEKLLVMLSRETDESLHEAAAWAAAEIPGLRKIREEVRTGRQEIYATAARLMKSHDYEQACRLLQEYPFDLRTPKMQQLLEQAEGLASHVELLKEQIKAARTRGDNSQLKTLLRELLEIRPGDRKARELLEQLTKKPLLVRIRNSLKSAVAWRATGTRRRGHGSFRVRAVPLLLGLILLSLLLIAPREFHSRNAYHDALAYLQEAMANSSLPNVGDLRMKLGLTGAQVETLPDEDAVVFTWASRINRYEITVFTDGDQLDGFQTGRIDDPVEALPEAAASESVVNADPVPDVTRTDAGIPGIIPSPEPLPNAGDWQIATRKPHGRINDIDFSPSGSEVAIAVGYYVRVLDAETLTLKRILVGQRGETLCVEWSPDGQQIAAAGTDGSIRIWNSDGVPQASVTGNQSAVTDVAWSHDGSRLAFADNSRGVVICSPDGSLLQTLELQDKGGTHSVDWHPDGSLAAGTQRGIVLFDPEFKARPLPRAHSRWTCAVRYSPDGRWLVGSGQKVERFSADGSPVAEFDASGYGLLHRIAWSPDSQSFAVARHPRTRIFSTEATDPRTLNNTDNVDSVAWSSRGSQLLAGGYRLAIVKSTDWSQQLITTSIAAPIYGMDIQQGSQKPANGCWDQSVVWEPDGRSRIVIPHRGDHFRFLPGSDDFITISWPNQLFRIAEGGERSVTYTPEDSVKPFWSLAVSDDGSHVAVRVSHEGQHAVRIWNSGGALVKDISLDHTPNDLTWTNSSPPQLAVTVGQGIRFFEPDGTFSHEIARTDRPDYLAISRDGRQLAIGRAGIHGIQICDDSGQLLAQTPPLHGFGTNRLTWSPDGQQVAWNDLLGHEIHISDPTGRVTHRLDGHAHADSFLKWSPDGQQFVTAGRDGTLLVRESRSMRPRWVGLTTRNFQASWTHNGQLLTGDQEVLDHELVYLVKEATGAVRIMEGSLFGAMTLRKADQQILNLVRNDSFERPWIDSRWLGSADSPLEGWEWRGCFIHHQSVHAAARGMQSMQIDAGRGELSQILSTQADRDYILRFSFARHPTHLLETPARMRVSWDGQQVDELTDTSTDRSPTDMKWVVREYRVRSGKAQTTLTFTGLSGRPALDAVSVSPAD
ncbi:MAG: protein kinase [Planctomycetaceae bacterium]